MRIPFVSWRTWTTGVTSNGFTPTGNLVSTGEGEALWTVKSFAVFSSEAAVFVFEVWQDVVFVGRDDACEIGGRELRENTFGAVAVDSGGSEFVEGVVVVVVVDLWGREGVFVAVKLVERGEALGVEAEADLEARGDFLWAVVVDFLVRGLALGVVELDLGGREFDLDTEEAVFNERERFLMAGGVDLGVTGFTLPAGEVDLGGTEFALGLAEVDLEVLGTFLAAAVVVELDFELTRPTFLASAVAVEVDFELIRLPLWVDLGVWEVLLAADDLEDALGVEEVDLRERDFALDKVDFWESEGVLTAVVEETGGREETPVGSEGGGNNCWDVAAIFTWAGGTAVVVEGGGDLSAT